MVHHLIGDFTELHGLAIGLISFWYWHIVVSWYVTSACNMSLRKSLSTHPQQTCMFWVGPTRQEKFDSTGSVRALKNENYCSTRDIKPPRVVCHDPKVGFILYSNTSLVTGVIIIFNLRTASFRAYRTIWVRRSNIRHQASPRVSPRESIQRRKVELWARNVRKVCLNADIHITFRDLLHADGFTSPPKEGVLRNFSP